MVNVMTYEIKDNSLAMGILRGGFPFAGTFRDGGSKADIKGRIQWHVKIPDSKPEEGKIDVYTALFVFNRNIEARLNPAGCLRLDSELVSRLNANSAEAAEELLGALLAGSSAGDRFDVHCER